MPVGAFDVFIGTTRSGADVIESFSFVEQRTPDLARATAGAFDLWMVLPLSMRLHCHYLKAEGRRQKAEGAEGAEAAFTFCLLLSAFCLLLSAFCL
jgi:hypothetical protein